VAHFSSEALVWTHYFEKPGKKLDAERVGKWDDALELAFGGAIDAACTKHQIPATKSNRSQILALAVITRGSELRERVMTAAKFYKTSVLAEEIL
jgi:hypothetical protein